MLTFKYGQMARSDGTPRKYITLRDAIQQKMQQEILNLYLDAGLPELKAVSSVNSNQEL